MEPTRAKSARAGKGVCFPVVFLAGLSGIVDGSAIVRNSG